MWYYLTDTLTKTNLQEDLGRLQYAAAQSANISTISSRHAAKFSSRLTLLAVLLCCVMQRSNQQGHVHSSKHNKGVSVFFN